MQKPLFLFAFTLLTIFQIESDEIENFFNTPHPLPRYVEANYSPLGRSPAVDALLSDPFYIPYFAENVSQKLEEFSKKPKLEEIAAIIQSAGGIPMLPSQNSRLGENVATPEKFIQTFGLEEGQFFYAQWKEFLSIAKEVQRTLSNLTDSEKKWLRENFECFFFGENSSVSYDFFTSESRMPLQFFELASKIDIAGLARSSNKLARIVDAFYERRERMASLDFADDFHWDEEDLKLWISGRELATFKEDADFFLHLKGNCKFENNAGGTKGVKPLALHISLLGNNLFIGDKYVQGAGVLGIGILANFSGNNVYKAKTCSQGAAFLGVGGLLDLGGHSDFQIGYFGQSAALFGTSLLWNGGGESLYFARDGMAQAASSTLGCAFLIDSKGGSTFVLGSAMEGGDLRSIGIGQGASIGVRYDPWKGNPSFYGGFSFLFAGDGKNRYKGGWYSQGSAYFLGAGILVDRGDASTFSAEVDSQGQGLHLACGCMLTKHASRCDAGFGSLGAAGDRSAGFLINAGGNGHYLGDEQTIGSARKPKALGVFLNFEGNNTYLFENLSCGNLQYPRSPLEWPKALFLTQGMGNRFSKNVDQEIRCENCQWGIPPHSYGFDLGGPNLLTYSGFIDALPKGPRGSFAFDPILGSKESTAFRPLRIAETNEELNSQIKEILTSGYEARRRLYECLDLYRFLRGSVDIDLTPLLREPANAPVDRFNYAALWALNDKNQKSVVIVAEPLEEGIFSSPYAEKMAIKIVGELGNQREIRILEKAAVNGKTEENRALAVYYLAKGVGANVIPVLQNFRDKGGVEIRFALALGLKDKGPLELLVPMLDDPNFYVRRRAALSAISLHYKPAIPILLKTLDYPTLDTTENYGDNVFSELSKYVGADFGTDPLAWKTWWEGSKDTFQFPSLKH